MGGRQEAGPFIKSDAHGANVRPQLQPVILGATGAQPEGLLQEEQRMHRAVQNREELRGGEVLPEVQVIGIPIFNYN